MAIELLDGMHDMPMHAHDYVEVVVVESGSAVHTTRVGGRRVGPGFSAVIRPGEIHSWTDTRRRLKLWNLYVGPEVFSGELRWFRETTVGSRLIGLPQPGQQVERQLGPSSLQTVIDWLRLIPDKTVAGPAVPAARLGALSGALGEIAAAPSTGVNTRADGSETVNPVVARAVGLLQSEMAHPWTTSELAARVHLSPSHLSRIFTQTTGMPPMGYLARLRAEHVAAELITSNTSISDIGARYGWPDPNYLSRRFRSFFGTSPREFRHRFGHGPTDQDSR